MPLQDITYSKELEKLLKNQAEQAESYSILHNLSYEKYQFRSNIINIPVIVLSSVIGLLTGMNIQNDDMFIILSTGSIFVSVIKSIDSYFQLQKRSEGHRICSLQFSQIFNKIQIELSLSREQRQNPKDMLALIKTDLKNLFDIAPLIDADIIKKYNSLYKNETGVSKPPITNGLTHIVVQGDTTPPAPPSSDNKPTYMYYDPDIDNPALAGNDDPSVIMKVKPIGSKEWINTKIDASGNAYEEPSIDVVNVILSESDGVEM
jgi:hypothetical protein